MTQTLNRNQIAATNRTNKTRNRITLLFFFLATLTATAFNAPKAHAGCPGHPGGCSKAAALATCGPALTACYAAQPYPHPSAQSVSYNTGCYAGFLKCKADSLLCPCP